MSLFVQFYECVSTGNLKAGGIGRSPTLLSHPSIHKLSTERQATVRIPNDIGGGVAALMVGVFRQEGRILDLQPAECRAGSNRLRPVVLVTDPGSKRGHCF